MPSKQGWARGGDGWARKEKVVDAQSLVSVLKMTERLLETTEEVAPAIVLGKTVRIVRAILATDIQEELLHETSTLANYMVMVQADVEELKVKVKKRLTAMKTGRKKDIDIFCSFKEGLDRVMEVHRILVNASHNLEEGLKLIKPHLASLRKHFTEHCTDRRTEELLLAVFGAQGWVGLADAYTFILFVRCCYLQIVTIFDVNSESLVGAVQDFESFNNSSIDLIMFLRNHEEDYYLKHGIRIRM
jgi:hypothetical protein